MSKQGLIDRLQKKRYDAVLTQVSDKVDAEVMDANPSVRIFANFAIGYDNFDIASAKERKVFLTNTPCGGAGRVAEHAWALILALSCRIVEADSYVRQGKYTGFAPMLFLGTELKAKVLGLIGVGHIGTEVARIASQGFGMRVAYYDVVRNPDVEKLYGVTYWPTVEEVLKQSDVVSLHVPLLDSTRHLINAERLKTMKPKALLINTSRGPVVHEASLYEALKDGTIAGAGLDVFENEPNLTPGLSDLTNVVLTPHIASATLESREEMAAMAANNVIDVLEGSLPKNNVYNLVEKDDKI